MIQTILFVAGINTLQQTFFGTRLPAVIGASYTYVPTTISIILAGRYSDVVNPQEVVSMESHHVFFNDYYFMSAVDMFYYGMQKFEKIMRGTQGALIVASILQIVVGFSGLWRNVARLVKESAICLKFSEFFLVVLWSFSLSMLFFHLSSYKCFSENFLEVVLGHCPCSITNSC